MPVILCIPLISYSKNPTLQSAPQELNNFPLTALDLQQINCLQHQLDISSSMFYFGNIWRKTVDDTGWNISWYHTHNDKSCAHQEKCVSFMQLSCYIPCQVMEDYIWYRNNILPIFNEVNQRQFSFGISTGKIEISLLNMRWWQLNHYRHSKWLMKRYTTEKLRC